MREIRENFSYAQFVCIQHKESFGTYYKLSR